MITFRLDVGSDLLRSIQKRHFPNEGEIRNIPCYVRKWCEEHKLIFEYNLEAWPDYRDGPSYAEYTFENEDDATFFKLVWMIEG